ncbi:competence type IV pilus assembly protein ComGB [Aciduricibacillus chroicocephali]|uniref:Competence type IV pilus assembly protein ComGB n=1 Tax=Aciduricibacillus chroicocephali TaxID=3054939 RepID=A0ABY9L2L2_9BACI|nr:competence type IV pilus assembly protein ComGB [Bacillaceae bacterium 44XB]
MKRFIKKRKKSSLSVDLQLRFLKRLLRLLERGYPLLESLEIIKWDQTMNRTASRMIALLKSGLPMDITFEKCGFNKSIASHLYFIHTNNDLVGSLEKSLSFFENRLLHAKKLQQTIRYPIVLFFVFTVLLFFIKQSVLPSFLELFQEGSGSAWTVKFSIRVIDYFISGFFVTCLLIIFITVFWLIQKKSLPIQKQISIYRRIPGIRSYLWLNTSYQFASHITSLLKTGMSFKEIFQHMSDQEKLPILAFYSSKINATLQKGAHLSTELTKLAFLDSNLSCIFEKNADYTSLEKDLDSYAEMVIDNIQRKIKNIIGFIQPLSFIVLGFFIIIIYMTLMWPMFQLIQSI